MLPILETPDFDEVDITAWFNLKSIDVSGLLRREKYKPRTGNIEWLDSIDLR